MDSNNAFEILKEEMENDDLSVRINTMHKLPIVATLMTNDVIKSSLIPYLDGIASFYLSPLQEGR